MRPSTRSRPGVAMAAVLALALGGGCGADPASAPVTPTAARPTASPSASPRPSASASPSVGPSPSVAVAPARWTRVTAAGAKPAAREDHTWTVAGDGATAYLFGGRDGSTVHGDLVAYDLASNSWRRLDPEGPRPAARFGHEAVWVDGVGLVVFAGQADPTTFFGDLWAYDPSADRWTVLPAGGSRPVPRYGTCSAVGPDGRLWISHGFTEDGTRFADTRAYDFGRGRWTDETPRARRPIERCLHGCFFDTVGRFVLYAGQTTGVEALGDLWALGMPGTAAAAWSRIEGRLPAERNLYAYARIEDGWLIVGGRGIGSRYLGDGYVVDATSLAVTPLRVAGRKPPGRAGATLIADGDRVLLFGGTNGRDALGDLWRLDPGTPSG